MPPISNSIVNSALLSNIATDRCIHADSSDFDALGYPYLVVEEANLSHSILTIHPSISGKCDMKKIEQQILSKLFTSPFLSLNIQSWEPGPFT